METPRYRARITVGRIRGALWLSGVAAVIAGAAPAHANPESTDAAFLTSLQSAGLTFASNDRAIAAGHSVCGLIENGMSGLQVVKDVTSDNPGLSMDDAAQFAAIAANSYCPQQLAK